MIKADVLFGLVYGDCGKGCITNELIKSNNYTHCLRSSGGANAGHTIYIGDDKVVTHAIPSGALHGVRSIIGPGCVINEKMFFEELESLEKSVPGIASWVKIAYNTHVTTEEHLAEEIGESKIGTTKKGIGPAYRDKYGRTGIRAESVPAFKDYVVDIYEEFHSGKNVEIMCEGAQAIGLDIDWGNYPYVTSSHCGVGSVLNNGIPHNALRNVIGVAKCYDTYVGSSAFQDPNDPILKKLGDAGHEYGATTGRRRQINYLNLDMIIRHVNMMGPNKVYFNKLDILAEVGAWKLIYSGKLLVFEDEKSFTTFVEMQLPGIDVIFSSSPYGI